jgi:hypothetical protein
MTMLAVCAFMLSFDALCGLAADWAGYRGTSPAAQFAATTKEALPNIHGRNRTHPPGETG